jgi:hypothetical protein
MRRLVDRRPMVGLGSMGDVAMSYAYWVPRERDGGAPV